MTIGGYFEDDKDSDIEWYNMHWENGWTTNLTAMNFTNSQGDDVNLLSSYSSLEAPKAYGHFNSSYPFLGVDEETFELIKFNILEKPESSCQYDKITNPWGLCTYKGYEEQSGTTNCSNVF